uniref:Uncharacterized protein n=1 Tax=Timema shepardi TaxID=629360 RepID=A0A7R9FWS6_TIMSH|nr:unnamed protein product [Timema shepardi]
MSELRTINPGGTENCLRRRLMKELIMELISEERLSKKSPELTLTWCDLSVYKELIMELISEERLSKKSPELTLTWCDLSVYVKRKHDTSFWTRQRFEQIQILNNGIVYRER